MTSREKWITAGVALCTIPFWEEENMLLWWGGTAVLAMVVCHIVEEYL